jgi:hypothetical protein
MAFRFNGGAGALTCDVCSRIFKEPAEQKDSSESGDFCPTHLIPINTMFTSISDRALNLASRWVYDLGPRDTVDLLRLRRSITSAYLTGYREGYVKAMREAGEMVQGRIGEMISKLNKKED